MQMLLSSLSQCNSSRLHGMQMISCVLAASPFPERYTAVNIAEKLRAVGLIAIVHDQGSNMQLAGEMMKEGMSCESINCVADRLQLCIEEGLSITAISQAIGAARKLVGHFCHSAIATSSLHNRQEAMGIIPLSCSRTAPHTGTSQCHTICPSPCCIVGGL